DLLQLAQKTEGFSGRDLSFLCNEAIRNMLRRANSSLINSMEDGQNNPASGTTKYHVSSLTKADFEAALNNVKPVVTEDMMAKFTSWSQEFGGR
ncbi:MAG: hypothetical protein QW597_07010, partial [Thermoplasmataceae archaeon]